MSNLFLKEQPTLRDYQQYVAQMIIDRGFDKETVPQLFMMLMEECGELAKAARKQSHIKTDAQSEVFKLGHEAVDVLMYLLDICNHFGIDLETAFREKEALNKKRTWN